MRVIVSSTGDTLDAQVSPVFGRCPVFLLVDTKTMEARAIPNPAVGASGGAGVQAAQLVVREGAEAILSGNLGPNAMGVIATAGIPAYSVPPVRRARRSRPSWPAACSPSRGPPCPPTMARAGRGMGRGQR